jgi:glutamate synthase domain-containing protein 3
MNNMRNRVVLETDGKLLTGRDIVIAALLGAEEFGFATAPLVVLGCDMMRVCNLDTCPVGIATQNPELCKKFEGKPEYIENLMLFLAEEVREWMARIGVRSFTELVGHAELLREILPERHVKARTVDLSRLLYQPKSVDSAGARYFTQPQNHALGRTLDQSALISLCKNAIDNPGEKASYTLEINNRNRTVGCMLSAEIVRRYGPGGLPDGSISLEFKGSSGLSFGAFLTRGITMTLRGETNDYAGKGLSGGRIVVTPPEGAAWQPSENVIAGNVLLYGATSGEMYIRGLVGERFCVRNSGAIAVAEGAGDHACEYMTGGTAVILGPIGRNFAAGMSGGMAYVYCPDGKDAIRAKLNDDMTSAEDITDDDISTLKQILENHLNYTGSDVASKILDTWKESAKDFIIVIPDEYKKIMAAQKKQPVSTKTRESEVRHG